jgi:hypothetical protein
MPFGHQAVFGQVKRLAHKTDLPAYALQIDAFAAGNRG